MGKVSTQDSFLLTAGGKIQCLRCTATSTRTKQQCGKPALKSSKTQKCQFHGGRSTGPITTEGKQRVAQAHTVHGQATNAVRREQSRKSLELAQIEDMMHLLEMSTATRSRGRKPTGYWKLETLSQAKQFVIDTPLHQPRASVEGREFIYRQTHRPGHSQ